MTDDCAHPDFATLVDWVEGRLDAAAAARVAAEVAAAGERTRRTADWLHGFLATARTMPLHEPPPIIRQSLSQHFARWRRAQAELEVRPREVPLLLLFDSRQDLAPAGVRTGAGDGDAIHLAYSADDGDLLLDVYDLGNGQVRIDGQALPADPAGAPVFQARLAGPGFEVRTTDGDELGRFSLPAVPAARCRLTAGNGVLTFVAEVDATAGGEQR